MRLRCFSKMVGQFELGQLSQMVFKSIKINSQIFSSGIIFALAPGLTNGVSP
jgi:hypothetical protein